jgi:mRNA interferase RelE/StbE
MTWSVIYHEDVAADLQAIGQSEARIILKVIEKRIKNGEPDKLGRALSGQLAGCRRIRTGSTRIVYRVNAEVIEVLIIAIGQRRDSVVYTAAENRV